MLTVLLASLSTPALAKGATLSLAPGISPATTWAEWRKLAATGDGIVSVYCKTGAGCEARDRDGGSRPVSCTIQKSTLRFTGVLGFNQAETLSLSMNKADLTEQLAAVCTNEN